MAAANAARYNEVLTAWEDDMLEEGHQELVRASRLPKKAKSKKTATSKKTSKAKKATPKSKSKSRKPKTDEDPSWMREE